MLLYSYTHWIIKYNSYTAFSLAGFLQLSWNSLQFWNGPLSNLYLNNTREKIDYFQEQLVIISHKDFWFCLVADQWVI